MARFFRGRRSALAILLKDCVNKGFQQTLGSHYGYPDDVVSVIFVVQDDYALRYFFAVQYTFACLNKYGIPLGGVSDSGFR